MKKHTILYLAANPSETDRLALDREARAIQIELERTRWRDRFELVTRWAAEPLDLLRELRRLAPTVVQFSGHGGSVAHGVTQTGLLSNRDVVASPGVPGAIPCHGLFFQGADGRARVVSTEALRDVFGAAGSSVKLVLLNACYSEPAADALIEHVDCVVGMAGSIGDDAARNFAIGFYGGLGDRASVDAAYRGGCAAIALEGYPDGDRPRLKIRRGVNADQLVLAAFTPAEPCETEATPSPAAAPLETGDANTGGTPRERFAGHRSPDQGVDGLMPGSAGPSASRTGAAKRHALRIAAAIAISAAATAVAVMIWQRWARTAPGPALPPDSGSATAPSTISHSRSIETTPRAPEPSPLVVDLTVWRGGVALAPRATLHVGDKIAFQVTASDSAYLFLVQRRPGDLSVLFPSDSIPLSNPIAPSVPVRIPTTGMFTLVDDGVYGAMSVDVIASREPLPDLTAALASVVSQQGEVLRRASQAAARVKLAEVSGGGSAGLIPRGDLVLLDGETRRTVSVRYTQRPSDRVVIAEFQFEQPR